MVYGHPSRFMGIQTSVPLDAYGLMTLMIIPQEPGQSNFWRAARIAVSRNGQKCAKIISIL